VLDRVAPKLKGQMAIGKIDCTTQKGLCKEFKVKGFPTLKYSIDGDINDYPSGRDEASIAGFASKMSAPAVKTVSSYEDAMEYAKTKTEEGVVFLGFDPSNSQDSPSGFYQVFSTVARKKQASGHFLWLEPSDPESIKSSAVVKRIEIDVKVRHLDNVESLTAESLTKWYNEQNLPLVSMLGPNNFQKIGKKGRPLTISIANTDDAEQVKALKDHMLNYISSTENDKYYYGIIDGKKFNRFLEQFNVKEEHIPQFLTLDVPTKTFWQNETYTNLFEFIKAIEDGVLAPEKASGVSGASGKGILAKVQSYFLRYFPYTLGVLLFAVFGCVWLLTPSYAESPYDQKHSALDDIMDDMDGTDEEPVAEGNENAEQAAPENKKDK
jgi:hypothetical protein